ncbi:hypothetical protein C8R43DRAFT_1231873 [Mycena crocata]|nr:hypothetical protein C8R43DRAFT_1231873 [Mycena crocata]
MPAKSSHGRATKDERALLLLSLSDPMHPDACCVIGLHFLLDRVLAKKTEDDSRQGPILRAAMAFISTERSDEEHEALREHLTMCRCTPRTRLFHRTVARPLTEVLELVLFVICGTISDYFMRLGPGKLRTERENVPPEAQPWPSRVSDIIPTPGGEKDVLAGLVQWAAVVPGGHSTFSLVGALARFWEPFAVELFHTPDVFQLATRHLRCAVDAYNRRAWPAEQMYRFISPVIACAQGLFFTVWEVDMSITMSILIQLYEEMYVVAAPIEPILAGLRADNVPIGMDDCRRWFSIVRRLRPVINPDGTFNIKKELSGQLVDAKRLGRLNFVAAFLRMVEIRNRNQCLHVLCTSQIEERAAVCGRCGIVRYCSRECQQAAWPAPHFPHKTLCKRIQRLRGQVCLTDAQAWNRTVRDDSALHREPRAFADAALKLGADARVAEAIAADIMRLTRARMMFVAGASKEEVVADAERVEASGSKNGSGVGTGLLPAPGENGDEPLGLNSDLQDEHATMPDVLEGGDMYPAEEVD